MKIKPPAAFTGRLGWGIAIRLEIRKRGGEKSSCWADKHHNAVQHRRAPLHTKDLQPSVMHESLRSRLHPAELEKWCCGVLRQTYGALLRKAHANHSSKHQSQSEPRVLLFRLLFINTTDNALPFHICTFVCQLPRKPVKNEYDHAAHNYDINDTPNHGTKPSSNKDF